MYNIRYTSIECFVFTGDIIILYYYQELLYFIEVQIMWGYDMLIPVNEDNSSLWGILIKDDTFIFSHITNSDIKLLSIPCLSFWLPINFFELLMVTSLRTTTRNDLIEA